MPKKTAMQSIDGDNGNRPINQGLLYMEKHPTILKMLLSLELELFRNQPNII